MAVNTVSIATHIETAHGMPYQEHAERVQRQRKGVEASTVQPDFVVAHGRRDVLPRDTLISDGIAVGTQASGDKFLLLRCNERGFGGPVHHVPVSRDAKNHGKYALDDEDPSDPLSAF